MAKKTVTVFFATNREPRTNASGTTIIGFKDRLGPVGGLNVRYGKAKVEVDTASQNQTIVPGSLEVADEKLFGGDNFQPTLGSNTIFDALRADMKTGKPTIAFLHGFANSFTDAIERAGRILAFYNIQANMFVFAWPSTGSVLGAVPVPYVDYVRDRSTAEASGPAVARTIRRLYDYIQKLSLEEHCDQSIHLLCHSTGAFVLRHALQALMRLPNPNADASGVANGAPTLSSDKPDPSVLRRTFDRIVMAAADEDSDAFDDPLKLKHLPRIGQSVTVYHSSKDWILNTLSAGTKFNGPRLGNDGPDNMATISDKVSAVDVSAVINTSEEWQNHQYYRRFAAVRDDIVKVMKGTPQNQIPNRVAVSAGRWRLKPK
jgi:esterase/lipase superfamily enzyme